ncbi:MAG TPA: sigma-70 family RNA polymerase sigma factor [Candidatus Angelobacter sp.]|nr:sigma-70 family RNA polymerase sigma factor [Candidatus Angelobacter sp.]
MSATNGFFSTAEAYLAQRREQRSSTAKVLPEDEMLMLRIQAGEEHALGLLLERYANIVLGIGLKVLRDREEAEELVQDVFFQVYRKCRLFDPSRGTARAWLLQTAYHRAFDRREYLRCRRFYDNRSVEEIAEEMRASSDVEYEAQVSQGETILRKAFLELTERQRQTLTLFFFEGYTLREISEHLKESLANIRHHYYRGLKHLKDNLDIATLVNGKQAYHGF